MRAPHCLGVAAVAGAAACAHATRAAVADRCAPRPGEVYGSTADSVLGGTGRAVTDALVDTERDLIPDPAHRTDAHLYALRYDLGQFRRSRSRLPGSIEEFSPRGARPIPQNFDGWGSSIRYTRLGENDYELRAPGADHKLCTNDDMIVRNDSFLNPPPLPPMRGPRSNTQSPE